MRGDLIIESLDLAAERGGDLTSAVYARLFREQPQTQSLFWRDSDGAIKGEMLARVFEAILDFVGERRYAQHMIQSEVVTHEGVDVSPKEFSVFFKVVADTVQDVLGADWTSEIDAAWRSLLAEIEVYVTHPTQRA